MKEKLALDLGGGPVTMTPRGASYAFFGVDTDRQIKLRIRDVSFFDNGDVVEHRITTFDSADGRFQTKDMGDFDNVIGERRVLECSATIDGSDASLQPINGATDPHLELGIGPKEFGHLGDDFLARLFLYVHRDS